MVGGRSWLAAHCASMPYVLLSESKHDVVVRDQTFSGIQGKKYSGLADIRLMRRQG